MAERVDDAEAAAIAMITLSMTELNNNNFAEAKKILEDCIVLAEANDLQSIAHIAYSNLGGAHSSLLDPSSAIQNYERSVAIGIKISYNYIETVFNLCGEYVRMGKLNHAENFMLIEIPQVTAASNLDKELFTNLCHGLIQYARGDWRQGAEDLRTVRSQLKQQSRSIHILEISNLYLALIISELNHFIELGDLSEAEKILTENLGLWWLTYQSYCLLSILSTRQGRLDAARGFIDKAQGEFVKRNDYIDRVSLSSA